MAESEAGESRIYSISLRRAWLSPRRHRAVRAVNLIRAFARRHMKAVEVRIDPELNQAVWARGIRFPPARVSVEMRKADDGVVSVALVGGREPRSDQPEESPAAKVREPVTPEAPFAEGSAGEGDERKD